MNNSLDVLRGKVCPYCNEPTVFTDSKEIYNGKSYGMIYLCRKCRAYVGIHKDSIDQALGRLANEDLREWKKKAHAAFDPIWRGKYFKDRQKAYDWLCNMLEIPRHLTHIGYFDIPECRKTVEVCTNFLKDRK